VSVDAYWLTVMRATSVAETAPAAEGVAVSAVAAAFVVVFR